MEQNGAGVWLGIALGAARKQRGDFSSREGHKVVRRFYVAFRFQQQKNSHALLTLAFDGNLPQKPCHGRRQVITRFVRKVPVNQGVRVARVWLCDDSHQVTILCCILGSGLIR